MTETRLVRRLAALPRIFDALRWLLEGGYRGHRQVIARHLRGAGKVLDLGCGTGIYAVAFAAQDYTGVDLSADYVAAASAKFPGHTFQVEDARRLSFPSQTYDACFISGVLHHLDDEAVAEVLREARRVTRTGGRIVIWEDVPARWWNAIGHLIHRLDLGAHIRTPGGYRMLIEPHVEVLSVEPMTSGFMNYAVFICRPSYSTGFPTA